MADVSLVARNVAATPKAYVVPGAQEFILKAVTAAVDGSGAAGSFQPVLQMVSPAGDVMWSAVGDTVAAGGSAEVSWFPAGGLGGAASSALPFAVYSGTGLVSIPSNTSTHPYGLPLVGTSDSSVFAAATGPDGVTGPQINAVGTYLVSYGARFRVAALDLPSDSAQMIWNPVILPWVGLSTAYATFNYSAAELAYFATPGATGLIAIGPNGDHDTGTVFNAELQQDSGTSITPSPVDVLIVQVAPTASGVI